MMMWQCGSKTRQEGRKEILRFSPEYENKKDLKKPKS
jgi:hypothetical protein